MKEPKCTICGGAHYKSFCFQAPRKAIKQSAIKKPTYEQLVEKSYKRLRAVQKPKSYNSPSKAKKPVKRARIASQSDSYRATLIREADRVFSIYIRQRDSVNGYARCVTCGKRDYYKSMQNGHYVSRRKMSLRYDEKNCHVQCPRCNMELGGNLDKYKSYVIGKYGADILYYYRTTMQQSMKLTNVKLLQIIEEYKSKIYK